MDIENKLMFTKGEKVGEGQIGRLELTYTTTIFKIDS